jgi:hypothetical protein
MARLPFSEEYWFRTPLLVLTISAPGADSRSTVWPYEQKVRRISGMIAQTWPVSGALA